MMEVRFHGRGGQGMKTAAEILARAAYMAGNQTQDFPMYGAERRGAPVTSFVRYDRRPITAVGYVFEPDVVVVADDSLDFSHMLKGAKPGTVLLVNTGQPPDFLRKMTRAETHWVNATDIALKSIGRPVFNCALLGALVKLLKGVNLEHLKKAIAIELERHGETVVEQNEKAAEMGYRMVS